MTDMEFGRYGRILAGFYEGYFLQIRDDTDGTGGYYIFFLDDVSAPTDGADHWVKDLPDLESFIASAEWRIEWCDR